jgi:hypothetical protein
VTGQLTVASDWLPGLPAERLDVFRRALPNHDLKPRPADLFEADLPRVWLLADGRPERPRYVVGLFNWEQKAPARLDLEAGWLGLAPGETYVGFDYWADRFVPPFQGTLAAEVPPGSCRVLALRPAAGHPQVVSTSRHVTQGVVDLADERWNADAATLAGTSRVVAGDPYEVRIMAGRDGQAWTAGAADLLEAPPDATVAVTQDGPHVRLRIASPATGEVRWRVRFGK